jgi:hypothetical protein
MLDKKWPVLDIESGVGEVLSERSMFVEKGQQSFSAQHWR